MLAEHGTCLFLWRNFLHSLGVIEQARVMDRAAVSEAGSCAQIAAALQAEKLILMTDVPGVLRDKNDVSTKFTELSIRQTRNLVADGIIAGGMIPKCALLTWRSFLHCSSIHIGHAAGVFELPTSVSSMQGSVPALKLGQGDAPCVGSRRLPCSLCVLVCEACARVQGGVLRAVPGAGRARHAHHRRPPGALSAAGAAHR